MSNLSIHIYYQVLQYLRLDEITNLYYLNRHVWYRIIPELSPYIKHIYEYKIKNNKIGLIKLHKLYIHNDFNKLIIKQYPMYIEKNYTENQWLALMKCYKVDYSFLKLAYKHICNIDNKNSIFNWCNIIISNRLYYNDRLYRQIRRKQL